MVSYRKTLISDAPVNIGVGAKNCFVIYTGAAENTIKKMTWLADSLNKTSDKLKISVLTRETTTPNDEDFVRVFEGELSDAGSWSNYRWAIDEDIFVNDTENIKNIYILIENLAGNSGATDVTYRLQVDGEMED